MADKKDKVQKKVKRPTVQKRAEQNERRRLRNRAFRSRVSTAIRAFESSLTTQEPGAIQEKLSCVYSLVDKGVKVGIYHLNTASRVKAKLWRKVPA